METTLAFLALFSELLLIFAAGAGVFALVSGPMQWPAAIVAALAVVVIWASFMSPKAGRRLVLRGRIVVGCLLFLVAGGLWALSNVYGGLLTIVLGCAVTILAQPMMAKHQDD